MLGGNGVERVLVLNSIYQALNLTTLRRSIKMLCTGKAQMVAGNGHFIRGCSGMRLPVPTIIRLNHFVRLPIREVPLTRKNILWRDSYTCQYCGHQQKKGMTVDHLVPRSLGGHSSWENMVCACPRCNNRKNNRLPQAAGMVLLRRPYRPHFQPWLYDPGDGVPAEWSPYLWKREQ